jgi:small-conductance mechanosensitive channel
MADVILAAFVLGPLVLAFLLKSNAALSFLSLCAGFVALSFAGSDLQDLTGQLNFSISSGIVNLVLLILPLLFTLLFTKGKAKSGFSRVINLIIALCAGGLLALSGIPLLNESIRANFADSDPWDKLQSIQAPLIGAGVFLSLVMVWAKALKKTNLKGKKH